MRPFWLSGPARKHNEPNAISVAVGRDLRFFMRLLSNGIDRPRPIS